MGACFSCCCFPCLCCGGALAGLKAIPHHYRFHTMAYSPKDKRRYAVYILVSLVVTIVLSAVWYSAVAPSCRNKGGINDNSLYSISCYDPSTALCQCYHNGWNGSTTVVYTQTGCISPAYNTTACEEYHDSGACDTKSGTDDDTAFFPWEIPFDFGFVYFIPGGSDNCNSPIGLATTFFCVSFAAFFFFLAVLYSQEERVFKEIFG